MPVSMRVRLASRIVQPMGMLVMFIVAVPMPSIQGPSAPSNNFAKGVLAPNNSAELNAKRIPGTSM